jgi:hypothetical protein
MSRDGNGHYVRQAHRERPYASVSLTTEVRDQIKRNAATVTGICGKTVSQSDALRIALHLFDESSHTRIQQTAQYLGIID